MSGLSDADYQSIRDEATRVAADVAAAMARSQSETQQFNSEQDAQELEIMRQNERLAAAEARRKAQELEGYTEPVEPAIDPASETPPVDQNGSPDEVFTETPGSDDEAQVGDLNKRVTRVVNGKNVTKTLHEWLETAAKVEEADDYLSDAANHLLTVQQPTAEETEDDLSLVRAIQTGNEQEATEAIRKIRQGATRDLQKNASAQAQRLAGQKAFDEWTGSNPLWKDPLLRKMAVDFADQITAQGKRFSADPVQDLARRLEAGGKYVADWYSKQVQTTQQQTELETLRARKAAASGSEVKTTTTRTAPINGAPKRMSREEQMAAAVAEEISGSENNLLKL